MWVGPVVGEPLHEEVLVMTDLRYAIRMLRKSPGVAAAVILSLGLGIGANSVIFTWVKAVLLDPLPGVARQRDLVAVATETRDGGYIGLSYPDYRDYRDRVTALDGLAVTETTTFSLGAMSRGRARRTPLRRHRIRDLLRPDWRPGGARPDVQRRRGSGAERQSRRRHQRRLVASPVRRQSCDGGENHLDQPPSLFLVGILPQTSRGRCLGSRSTCGSRITMQPQLLPGR